MDHTRLTHTHSQIYLYYIDCINKAASQCWDTTSWLYDLAGSEWPSDTYNADELSWLSHSSCLPFAAHLPLRYLHVHKEVDQKGSYEVSSVWGPKILWLPAFLFSVTEECLINLMSQNTRSRAPITDVASCNLTAVTEPRGLLLKLKN